MIQIDLDAFHGPMDLLLELLHQSKLDIYAIEISQITEQFLDVMQQMHLTPEELSDFIRMASILVQMKARMLLQDQNEDEEIPVSREEFIRRLVAYRTFKELSARLRPGEEQALRRLVKMQEDPERFRSQPLPMIEGQPDDLLKALRRLDERKRSHHLTFHVDSIMAMDPYPDDVVAKRIRSRLEQGTYFTFADLFDTDHAKGNLITTFLLLLELSRREVLEIRQKGENHMISISVGHPEQAVALLNQRMAHQGNHSEEYAEMETGRANDARRGGTCE